MRIDIMGSAWEITEKTEQEDPRLVWREKKEGSENMKMKIYEVPPISGKKGRPRFRTEAEREKHREAVLARHRHRMNENLRGATYRGGLSIDRKPLRMQEGADGRLPYGMAMLVKEAEARPFLDNCRLRVERLLRGRL